MLPLIPALLLLILNGPANAEQPAQRAQWTSVFRVFQLGGRAPGSELANGEESLKGLLSLSDDPRFTRALYHLLWDSMNAKEQVDAASQARAPFVPILGLSDRYSEDAYQDCRRSRDGPSSR